MKTSSKPFTLNPKLINLQDSSAARAKKENWEVAGAELKKFGIRLSNDQRIALYTGTKPTLIKETL